MENLSEVYVALGGNIGDVASVFAKVLEKLFTNPSIFELKTSRFYQTSPVSDLPQNSFINAVCSFKTSYEPEPLWNLLQEIEIYFGKKEKPKNFPRPLDLDLLFYGEREFKSENLEIPHARWSERLFVLIPLFDLVDEIKVPLNGKIKKYSLLNLIENFENINQEQVKLL